MNLENLLNQLVNQTDDGLILFLGDSFPSGNVESVQTSVLCQEGAGYYNGYCGENKLSKILHFEC